MSKFYNKFGQFVTGCSNCRKDGPHRGSLFVNFRKSIENSWASLVENFYGLPKIHKEGSPMRPILFAIGTSGIKLSKFIKKFLTPLNSNEFTLEDSFAFVNKICAIPNYQNYTMASFDLKSLFTNIPINETINIACDTLFDPDDNLTLSSLEITSNNFWN